MGKALANYLLMNLLERATIVPEKTVLTTREIAALATLLDSKSYPEIAGNEELALSGRQDASRCKSAINGKEANCDVMRGVDFGTSFY
jgi:hypothetical protein